MQMMVFGQRHPGHTNPQNARKRHYSLPQILVDDVVPEPEYDNQENQHTFDEPVRESPPRLRHNHRPNLHIRARATATRPDKEGAQEGKHGNSGAKEGQTKVGQTQEERSSISPVVCIFICALGKAKERA